MKRKRKLILMFVMVILVLSICSFPVSAIPVLPDSNSLYDEEDYFGNDTWGMTVYSYVYDSTCNLPNLGVSLNSDEMLFVHLLDCNDVTSASIIQYSVSNPDEIEIPDSSVGASHNVVPDGYDTGDYQTPFLCGYSGSAQAEVYIFFFDTLDPHEWSMVYYKATASEWGPVSATANSGGYSDNQQVPGPILPEPATILLLGISSCFVLLRRKRGR